MIPVLLLDLMKDLSEGMSQAEVSVEKVMKEIAKIKS